MQTKEDELELVAQVADRTIYGYAENYVVLDGAPFSFAGHNYLIGIYQDRHPYIVMEKGAQLGASIASITRALYVCDVMGMNVIYFFPTDQDVSDFSKGRVAPIIEESPHLKAIVDKADSIGLRQVGRGFLYFRGMRSSIRAKSVAADFIVFDELDETTDDQEALADQRINHSKLRWRMKLSTPTFEGYGIDRDFKKSDMRYWNLICKSCGQYNILEESFPECIKRVSDTKAYLQCFKCKAELDTQWGQWIAKNPERERIRGYHLCGLYSIYADLPAILEDYTNGVRLKELYRSKLGIPYTPAEERLTLNEMEACIDPTLIPAPQRHCYMGVDQKGDEIHIVVRAKEQFTNKPQVIYVGKVREFHELDYYLKVYDVDLCVVDGTPNQHSARDFASRNPGRVYLCYYNDNQTGMDTIWSEPKDNVPAENREWKVSAPRTEVIDAVVEEIQQREVSFPRPSDSNAEKMKEFFFQHTQMARVSEEDDDGGLKRTFWKKLGADHYAHANVYSYIAMTRYGKGRTKMANLVSPNASRVLYSRHYEQGSRY